MRSGLSEQVPRVFGSKLHIGFGHKKMDDSTTEQGMFGFQKFRIKIRNATYIKMELRR